MQEGLMSIDTVNVSEKAAAGDLYSLKIRDLWAFFKSQDALFWLISLYLFLEYVRPQTLYPVLDILPYTQIIILLTLLLFFMQNKVTLVQNIENRLLLCFFGVILLSSIFAMSPAIAFAKLPEFIAWMLVYFLIVNIVNSENRFLLFLLMFLLYNLKMSQFALRGWASIGFGFGKDGTGGGPGWFQNSGEFGIEMCVFFSLAVYFIIALKDHWPKWKLCAFLFLPLTALAGIISSSSRGALVGGAAVLAWMLFKSKRKFFAVLMVGIVCIMAYNAVPHEQKARFETAGEDRTSINRTERWQKGIAMANKNPLLGVGYGNWVIADRIMFSGEGALSHNAFIECVSELGYSGLFVYALMIVFCFVNNYRTRNVLKQNNQENGFAYYMAHGLDGALVGYLVSGFFVTVLYYPYFWINLALTVALNGIAQRQQPAHVQ